MAYAPPTIKSVTVQRCDSAGIAAETGMYCKIAFSWSCCQLTGANPVKTIAISWLDQTVNVSATGNEGPVSQVLGGALDNDKSYVFTVTVTDTKNGVSSVKKTLGATKFPIDFKMGGTGVAFGKPAELDNTLDVNYEARFRTDIILDSPYSIRSRHTDGSYHYVFQGQNQYGNTVLGYGNYTAKSGNTNIYGHNLSFGISDLASPTTYKPYYSRGDIISITFRSAGYVTNSGRDVSFWIPLAKPVIGNPIVSATSVGGFVLRQGGKYTHGSAPSAGAKASQLEAYITYGAGIYMKVVFTNATNVTNNDAIGIYWEGKITLS